MQVGFSLKEKEGNQHVLSMVKMTLLYHKKEKSNVSETIFHRKENY